MGRRYMIEVEVKRAEQFLRASDEYIEQELVSVLDGMEVEDPDGKGYMSVSVSATTFLGQSS